MKMQYFREFNKSYRQGASCKYPKYLRALAVMYSRSYRTMTRWHDLDKMAIHGVVPYSFSWIVWEIEHNHRSVSESILTALYKMGGL